MHTSKLWSVERADREIADYVKWRDAWRCFFCQMIFREGIDASHYFGRTAASTRFDPQNIDAACRSCHIKYENDKKGYYKRLKELQLGIKGFKELEKRHNQGRDSMKQAIVKLMLFLNKDT